MTYIISRAKAHCKEISRTVLAQLFTFDSCDGEVCSHCIAKWRCANIIVFVFFPSNVFVWKNWFVFSFKCIFKRLVIDIALSIGIDRVEGLPGSI